MFNDTQILDWMASNVSHVEATIYGWSITWFAPHNHEKITTAYERVGLRMAISEAMRESNRLIKKSA